MYFSEHPGVLPDPSLNSFDRSSYLEKGQSTPASPTNLRRMEIKREALTNTSIVALMGMALVPLFGLLVPQKSPHQYEGRFQFVVNPLVNQGKKSEVKGSLAPEQEIDYETQARVLWSPKVVSPIVQRLQANYPDLTTETLLRNLTVTHERDSNRLSVSYRSSDWGEIQAVLNQLAHSYLQFSQECHGGSCRAIQLIDQRLPKLKQQKAKSEQTLNALKQSVSIAEPDQLGQHLTQRAQILVQQQNQLQIQRAEACARSLILQKRLGLDNQPLADDLLQQHPHYQQLLPQLHQVVAQFFLVIEHPQSDQASLKKLQQRYQQLLTELSNAAQDAVLKEVPAIQLQAKIAKDSPELRLQILQEWISVTHQMRIIDIQQQEIGRSKQRVQTLMHQWAVFARKYDMTQLELQTVNSKLELYEHRKEALKALPDSRFSAQLVASPETVEVAAEATWPLSKPLLLGFTVPRPSSF